MISFGRHVCNDFRNAIEKEWVITNNNGSYASSTILMANTRKYHGLLSAKFPGIDNRIVLFPNFDEEVEIAGKIYHISTHKYKETVYPKGYSLLESFSINRGVVSFLFLIDNVRIKKEIFMAKDSNTTVVSYRVLTPESRVILRVKPLMAFREADLLVKEMTMFDPEVEAVADGKLKISAYMNIPPSYIYNPDKGKLLRKGVWYRDFYYIREEKSNGGASEDLYNIGVISFDMGYNEPRSIVISTEDLNPMDIAGLKGTHKKQEERIGGICSETGIFELDDDCRVNLQRLIETADSFMIKDKDENIFVATGYLWPHYIWFRDTFASLPGLFLVLKKFKEAKNILVESLEFEKNGLIPMSMTIDKNEMKYASVDTTLWFFFALYKYIKYTGDFDIAMPGNDFFSVLETIIENYEKGTDFNIHAEEDGLIYSGFPGIQLTWMDSASENTPVTPRQGKAVEVNALWYNAVRVMEFIAKKTGAEKQEKKYKKMADRIFKSFNREFWYEEGGYLYDHINGSYKDGRVRPNQVLAFSLPFEIITDGDKRKKIMNLVIKELYTSFGLRTLSNMDVDFCSNYGGGEAERERTAHQGTVWGWTTGHFVTAYLKTFGKSNENLRFVETVYAPFFEHLKNAGLGSISEMFDGSFPYTARGRISHAWAVAELIRSYFEDYLNAR